MFTDSMSYIEKAARKVGATSAVPVLREDRRGLIRARARCPQALERDASLSLRASVVSGSLKGRVPSEVGLRCPCSRGLARQVPCSPAAQHELGYVRGE